MVHRPPALKSRTPESVALRWLALVAIGTLELIWLAWFLLEPLPNAGNVGGNGLCRLNLVVRALPEVMLPGLKYRDSYLGLALAELGQLRHLPQRAPIVLASAFIAASAIGLGHLGLRTLRLRSSLGPWERVAVGYGLGTTGLGLMTLIAGRSGWLDARMIRLSLALPIVVEVCWLIRDRLRSPSRLDLSQGGWSIGAILGFAAVAGPFVLIMGLGAMLPTVDFDAIEYHLQGPKEYYQAGRIAFLPHNVYTSMPFSIEMLHLLGMEVVGDWWLGALVGQLLVAAFAPMAAVLIALTARRIGSNRAAWVSGVAYLTTPWIYRLAVLPYVEGPLCYFHAALVWGAFRTPSREPAVPPLDPRPSAVLPWAGLMGLLAGGAMAIKYPALISAVLPFSAWAAWVAWRSRSPRVFVAFSIGVAAVMAPWLGKNVIDTGNPVYPLAYKVFGSKHWDPARDAQWSAAHGPKPIEAGAFARSVVDVAGRSDWQSPLFACLAPLAFFRSIWRRRAGWLAGFCVYLFLTWWLLTHRLDRFWLPILPSLAILAGLGSDWDRSKSWTAMLGLILIVGVSTNAVYCSTALAGLNEWMGDLTRLRSSVPKMLNPPLSRLDLELPPGAKPLLVGQAAVFHLDRSIVYNTVFDDETIETLAREKTPREVVDAFRRLGVTHVYVDWFEVERYRSPGNYGFTPFVTPALFAGLVEAGVLEPPSRPGLRQELYKVVTGRSSPR